jgi:hypothetical protein
METEKDLQWNKACKEIIDRCVASNMYPQAMEMLHLAMMAAIRSNQKQLSIG